MEFEYDPAKSRANAQKHGIDFEQAKALWNVLGHNLSQYEQAFGSITLEQLPQSGGPVN